SLIRIPAIGVHQITSNALNFMEGYWTKEQVCLPPQLGRFGLDHKPVNQGIHLMVRSTQSSIPLVSIVTPFFNTAPYLAECIESVLAQSFTQFEYILMDNCSTDGSAQIAARYASRDARIRLIRCSEFLSQLANYNRAL